MIKKNYNLSYKDLLSRYWGPVTDEDTGITVDMAVGNIIGLFDDKFYIEHYTSN